MILGESAAGATAFCSKARWPYAIIPAMYYRSFGLVARLVVQRLTGPIVSSVYREFDGAGLGCGGGWSGDANRRDAWSCFGDGGARQQVREGSALPRRGRGGKSGRRGSGPVTRVKASSVGGSVRWILHYYSAGRQCSDGVAFAGWGVRRCPVRQMGLTQLECRLHANAEGLARGAGMCEDRQIEERVGHARRMRRPRDARKVFVLAKVRTRQVAIACYD